MMTVLKPGEKYDRMQSFHGGKVSDRREQILVGEKLNKARGRYMGVFTLATSI